MLTVGCWVVSCEVGWFGVLEVKVSRKSGKRRVEVCGWCPSFFPRDFLFGSKRPAGGQRQEKIIGCWGPCSPPAFLSLSGDDKVSISWYPLSSATANQVDAIQTKAFAMKVQYTKMTWRSALGDVDDTGYNFHVDTIALNATLVSG